MCCTANHFEKKSAMVSNQIINILKVAKKCVVYGEAIEMDANETVQQLTIRNIMIGMIADEYAFSDSTL
jgi:hypothetical protein